MYLSVPVCTCLYVCVHVCTCVSMSTDIIEGRGSLVRVPYRINAAPLSASCCVIVLCSLYHPRRSVTCVSQIMYSAQGRWRDRAVSAEVPEVPHVAVGPPPVKASAKPCDAVTVTSAGAGAGRGLRFGGVVGGGMCGVGDAVYFHVVLELRACTCCRLTPPDALLELVVTS